jgi:hypothetical protein
MPIKEEAGEENHTGKKVMSGEVPSLLRISLFAVKKGIIQAMDGKDKRILSDELHGLDDVIGFINQCKI